VYNNIFKAAIVNATMLKITLSEIFNFRVSRATSSADANVTVLSYTVSFNGTTEYLSGFTSLQELLQNALMSSNFTQAVNANAQLFGISNLNQVSTLGIALSDSSPSAAPSVAVFPSPSPPVTANANAVSAEAALDDGSIAGITWGGVFFLGLVSFLFYRCYHARKSVSPDEGGKESRDESKTSEPRKLTGMSPKSVKSVQPDAEQF